MATRPAERKFGIETKVLGTTFRSRLEARWALMFTALGWDWEYEPFDADGYIPDFAIIGDVPFLVEIKPCADTKSMAPAAIDAARSLISAEITAFDSVAVLGLTPTPQRTLEPWGGYGDPVPAGVVVQDLQPCEDWTPTLDVVLDDVRELAWAYEAGCLNVWANGCGGWHRLPSGKPHKPNAVENAVEIQEAWRHVRDVTRWKANG